MVTYVTPETIDITRKDTDKYSFTASVLHEYVATEGSADVDITETAFVDSSPVLLEAIKKCGQDKGFLTESDPW